MADLESCAALQTAAEATAASAIVAWLGLASHHDPVKNWDHLKALSAIIRRVPPEGPVLDAGSSAGGVIWWLARLGYRRLFACNLDEGNRSRYAQHGIRFTREDVTRTSYPDRFFAAVACLSVIEHGVPVEAFIREMERIIAPGGLLILSTDYWSEPIDCRAIYPYGPDRGEMKVFQRDEVESLCALASRRGFVLLSPLRLETRDKVVRWDRVDREFTFAFFALLKTSSPVPR